MNDYLTSLLETPDRELFMGGACHLFAVVLAEHLGPDGFCLCRLDDANLRSRHGRARHVFLVRGTTMADVRGLRGLADYIEQRRLKAVREGWRVREERALPCSTDELLTPTGPTESSDRGNKWSLILDEDFCAVCQDRARAYIDRNPGLFGLPEG